MNELVYQTNLKESHEDGIRIGNQIGFERGVECGKESTTMKIAKSLLKYGMSVADIAKNTGLTQKQVKELS